MLPSAVNHNLVLWMSHLDTAVSDVFQHMLGIPCQPAIPSANVGDQLKVAIRLSGDFDAQCTLYFTVPGARAATVAFTGDDSIHTDLLIHDAVGEIGNMIIGSLKSKLMTTLTSSMTVPAVSRESCSVSRLNTRSNRARRNYVFMGNAMQIQLAMPRPDNTVL